jgi:hypothetical protein
VPIKSDGAVFKANIAPAASAGSKTFDADQLCNEMFNRLDAHMKQTLSEARSEATAAAAAAQDHADERARQVEAKLMKIHQ